MQNDMKARIKLTNSKNQSESIIDYEKTKGRDWEYHTSVDGVISRSGDPSKWVESNGQEPIRQISNLLDGEVGGKWTHEYNTFELIYKE